MGEVFGPYRVHEQLGVGGMATVHRAEIVVDGQTHTVALKRLLPELTRDTSYVRRFVDEARLGQRLKHPNITKTFEVGNYDGNHFIALEYVRGPTLLRLLQRSMQTHVMPLQASLHIVTHITRALAYAHGLRDETGRALNLIHRDIAPGNIIVSETGSPKLIDFGVAKTVSAHVRTAAGSIIGKLGYVAPEYLLGRLDARVDIYSLGVVAYELLTARKLFDVEDLRSAEMLRSCDIEPPASINPQVPEELDAIVMTALERDPDTRWQSAYAMYTALANFAHTSGLEVRDADLVDWLADEIEQLPKEQPMIRTAEIALEIESDLEEAFARVRLSTLSDVA